MTLFQFFWFLNFRILKYSLKRFELKNESKNICRILQSCTCIIYYLQIVVRCLFPDLIDKINILIFNKKLCTLFLK